MTADLRKYRTHMCTCCYPRRDAAFVNYFDDGRDDWVRGEDFHRDDNTFASFMHAHLSTSGRDCDGGHGHESTMSPRITDGEGEDEYDFWARIVRVHVLSTVSDNGELKLGVDEDGDRFAQFGETTDEGWRRREAYLCTHGYCTDEPASQYDQYAEAAGY